MEPGRVLYFLRLMDPPVVLERGKSIGMLQGIKPSSKGPVIESRQVS